MIQYTSCINEKEAFYYYEVDVYDNAPPTMDIAIYNYTFQIGKQSSI